MLDEKSLKKLEGVHADLVKVVQRAAELADAEGLDFVVTEGLRTMKRQRELVAAGASKTMKSRHLTGHAIDFAPRIAGEITWKWPPFIVLGAIFKKAAAELDVAIEWGGDWKSFKDGPHIQLDWKAYPA